MIAAKIRAIKTVINALKARIAMHGARLDMDMLAGHMSLLNLNAYKNMLYVTLDSRCSARQAVKGGTSASTTSRVVPQRTLGPSPSIGLVPVCKGKGGAEMVGECCQDAGRTKAGRPLTKFFTLGSHLQAAAIELVLQEKVLTPREREAAKKLQLPEHQRSGELQEGPVEEMQEGPAKKLPEGPVEELHAS